MTTTDSLAAPADKPHRVGVLLVHGIGEQPLGGTLRQFVDPLVRALDLWLHGVARCRADCLGEAAANAWAQQFPTGTGVTPPSEARFREQAHRMAWSAQWRLSRPTDAQKAQIRESSFWSGGASLTNGVGAAEDDTPPHTVLHVHTLGEHYDAREGTALLAECWWSRTFVPATPWILLSWTLKVLPFAIGMHFGDIVRRRKACATDSRQRPSRRVAHALLAVLAFLFMLITVAFMTPAVLTLLIAVSVLSLLPIGAVRDAVINLQSAILGTLGDSCLLVGSPVSRAMIVERCARDLRWMNERCEHLFVVGHSQGCAVSYLALGEHLPDTLREVTWIGSGLRKLEALHDAERDDTLILAGWCMAALPWVLWSQTTTIHESGLSTGTLIVTLVAAAFYVYGTWRLLNVLRVGTTAIRLREWHTKGLRLSEVYATADPVPQGPLFDVTSQEHFPLPAKRVHNCGSWLSDHTAYWRNIEQIILPMGLKIAAALGVPVERLLADDTLLLERAEARRVHRVRALVTLRLVTIVGAVAVLWLESATLTEAASALMAWASLSDGLPMQAVLACLPALAWIILPYLGLVLAWHAWERLEQRSFLLRAEPSALLESFLVGAMVTASTLPIGGAAMLLWHEAPPQIIIAQIAVLAIFCAVFYVLAMQSPQKAFGFEADARPPK